MPRASRTRVAVVAESDDRATRDRDTKDGDTETRILEAAHTVFLRSGTAGARMLEIAREAGVNPALLHYYFRSKDRLAEAVFRRAAMRLLPPVLEVLTSDAELEDKVERAIAIELDQLSASPYLPAYVLGELNQRPERVPQFLHAMTGLRAEAVGTRLRDRLGRQLDARAAAGTLRPITPEQFVVNLLALCLFPFAARPLLGAVLQLDERGFRAFIAQRRAELPAFFLGALRP